jgi:hypothetical protein
MSAGVCMAMRDFLGGGGAHIDDLDIEVQGLAG